MKPDRVPIGFDFVLGEAFHGEQLGEDIFTLQKERYCGVLTLALKPPIFERGVGQR